MCTAACDSLVLAFQGWGLSLQEGACDSTATTLLLWPRRLPLSLRGDMFGKNKTKIPEAIYT